MEILLRSYAKINLNLKIMGVREDGYHEVDTVMQTVSLCDEITLSEEPSGIKILSQDPYMPKDESNLAYRAARLFFANADEKEGMSIEIDKNIPMGAGLGGGSANAAAVLLGLNELYGNPLDIKRLLNLAAEIGSDVPFFITGGRARCEGRGEYVKKLPSNNKSWYVIVKPNFSVSTKWAYQEYDRKIKYQKSNIKNNVFTNDLEEVVMQSYPEIERIKKELCEEGAKNAIMSGSGSAVWAEVENEMAGKSIKEMMTSANREAYLVHSVPHGVEIVR
ncbi:MAG: 4-(cytidine 5'-diphospho)-2-C-methyl-D-erythritol kinase [bacterium]